MSVNSAAPSTPCVQCSHAGRNCRVRNRNVHCNRCLQKDLDCSFRRNIKARDVDLYLPDLINSVEEILQGDFALLRSIAAGQKELLSLGRTILAELRKAPAMASDGTQRHNTLQGVSGGEVAGDVQKAGGPTHEEEYSVREWGVASAEAGDIPLVHADRGMDEEEHSGGDHKKGKDQRQRHDEDDDGDYVPSSSEQPPRKSHRGHSNCGQEVEGDASDAEDRPTKRKHKGKSTATMRDSPVASSSRANTHKKRKTASDIDDHSASATAESGEDTSGEEATPPLKFGEFDDDRREKFRNRRAQRLSRSGRKHDVKIKKEKR